MARPTKSASLRVGHMTNEEINTRLAAEKKLKSGNDKVKPPNYLSKKQKALFKYIVEELDSSGILTNLDIYILSTCVIAIDRLQDIERLINEDSSRIADRDLLSAKDKYTKDLFRCTNELSLSPQSRAKLANANVNLNKDKDDPLTSILARRKEKND